MSNILLKVENDGAERLWSYIIAYRKLITKEHTSTGNESSKNNFTSIIVPALELKQAQIGRSKNKNLKNQHRRSQISFH